MTILIFTALYEAPSPSLITNLRYGESLELVLPNAIVDADIEQALS
jgi:hypothetical protein